MRLYTVPSPANASNWLVSGLTVMETRQGSFTTCTKRIFDSYICNIYTIIIIILASSPGPSQLFNVVRLNNINAEPAHTTL